MNKLDDIIRERMKYIVYKENRSFSFLDFTDLVSKGTFRNKMCYVFKEEIEVVGHSPMTFYTLKGHNIHNSMTDNHTGDINNNINQNNINFNSSSSNNSSTYLCNLPMYRYIKNLPYGKRSIHDIRLRFPVKGLWSLLSNSSKFKSMTSSNDIPITKIERENLDIKATVHATDTVSVSVGCTFAPVELDINGLLRLSTSLAITEDRIRIKIEETKKQKQVTNSFHVSYYGSWLITLWHFGRDASITYEKKEFCIEYRTAQEIIYRIYDKEWKNQNKRSVRIEKQEYPNKSFEEAMEELLNK